MGILFSIENTESYTAEELAALDAEWEEYCDQHGIDEDSSNYEQEAKWFADRVARR